MIKSIPEKFLYGFRLLLFAAAFSSLASAQKTGQPIVTQIPYYADGRWGYALPDKKVIVKPEFSAVRFFSEGMGAVSAPCMENCQDYPNGLWGFVNQNGELKIPPQFQAVQDFREGLAGARLNGKWGFVDKSGQIVVPFSLDTVYPFYEGRAGVKAGNVWFLINKEGKNISSTLYEDMRPFSEGFAAVRKNGRWGYIRADGSVLVSPRFTDAGDFSEGYAVAEYNTRFQIIDKNGKITDTDQEYDFVGNFKEGFAVTLKKGHFGFITPDGKTFFDNIFPKVPDLESYPEFSTGIAAVPIAGRWGFVDLNGKEMGRNFDKCRNFRGELAPVRQGLLWGYMNRKGRIAIPLQYDDAQEMYLGVAVVKKGDYYGLIDEKGQTVSPFKWTYLERIDEHPEYFRAEAKGKPCIVDKKGTEFCE